MMKTTSILLLLSLVVTLLFISTTTASPAYRRHHSRRVYRRPTNNIKKRVFLGDDDDEATYNRRRTERGRPTLNAIIDAITKDLEKLLAAQKSKLSKSLSQQVKQIKQIKPVLPQKTFLPVAAAEEEILSDNHYGKNTFEMRRRRNGRNFGRKAQEQVKTTTTTTTEMMAETQEGEKTNADGSLTLIKIGGVTGAVADDCSACKLMCRSPGTVKVGRCLSKCASSEVCKFQDNIAFWRGSTDHDVVHHYHLHGSQQCVCNITIIIKWNLFNRHLSLHWFPSRASIRRTPRILWHVVLVL